MLNARGKRESVSVVASIFALAFLISLNACEDPGVVGSEFVDAGAGVKSDTLQITDYKTESDFPVFTGNKSYLSVGQYDDALFGEVTATGVMRPSISTTGVDTLHPEAEFSLSLAISTPFVYGDTSSTTELELVELNRTWRGVAWKIDSEVQVNQNVINAEPVEIGMQDSLVFQLKDDWYQKFRDFYYDNPNSRDSLYRYEFNGFALRAVGGNKIVAIDASNSSFLVNNPEDTVATELSLGDWGYTLNRENVPPLPDSLDRIYSTQERVINFNFTADSSTLGSKNISRAELAFSTAENRLSGSLPTEHVRPAPDVLNLYLLDPKKLEFSMDTYQASFNVQIDSVDFFFGADLTSFVNQQLYGEPVSERFIGTLRSNDGVIRSTVIHNDSDARFFPRLLITSVNPD